LNDFGALKVTFLPKIKKCIGANPQSALLSFSLRRAFRQSASSGSSLGTPLSTIHQPELTVHCFFIFRQEIQTQICLLSEGAQNTQKYSTRRHFSGLLSGMAGMADTGFHAGFPGIGGFFSTEKKWLFSPYFCSLKPCCQVFDF
jgi:hypothetical protein